MHILYIIDYMFFIVLHYGRIFLNILLALLLDPFTRFCSYLRGLYKRKNGSLYSISTRPIITVINYIY